MDSFTLINRGFTKHFIISVLFFIIVCSISFFSYDYLFYFVIVIDVIYVFCLLLCNDPIYILYFYIFSAFFDINGVFTFGGKYCLRIWYLLSFYVLWREAISFVSIGNLYVIKRKYFGLILFFILFSFFSVMSILINDYKVEAILFVAKIYLFYLPMMVAFIRWADNDRIFNVMRFMFFMIFGVSLFGMFESLTKIQGIKAIKYGLFISGDIVRPHGFFSETTWMGYMATVGVILSLYFYNVTNFKRNIWLSLPMLVVLVLSSTRGAYIGLGVAVLFLIIFGGKKNIKIVFKYIIPIWCFTFFVVGYFLNFDVIGMLLQKFRFTDDSAIGRIVAYSKNIGMLKENFISGLGYGYDEVTDLSKSTIGSKAFNVFLAIFSSLGIQGFLYFILGVSVFVVTYGIIVSRERDVYKKNTLLYGFVLFLSFLTYSQNAPLYLHPLGWVVMSISLAIYTNVIRRGINTP